MPGISLLLEDSGVVNGQVKCVSWFPEAQSSHLGSQNPGHLFAKLQGCYPCGSSPPVSFPERNPFRGFCRKSSGPCVRPSPTSKPPWEQRTLKRYETLGFPYRVPAPSRASRKFRASAAAPRSSAGPKVSKDRLVHDSRAEFQGNPGLLRYSLSTSMLSVPLHLLVKASHEISLTSVDQTVSFSFQGV